MNGNITGAFVPQLTEAQLAAVREVESLLASQVWELPVYFTASTPYLEQLYSELQAGLTVSAIVSVTSMHGGITCVLWLTPCSGATPTLSQCSWTQHQCPYTTLHPKQSRFGCKVSGMRRQRCLSLPVTMPSASPRYAAH